ncbi:MAG TPA: zinc ribbon domain-containing protein [Methanosarcina sp.]|nr:zinc ribbon domain-containing protein [Methanosarcina sp.]
MMYANKLAVAVKSNGKVLREFKDTVYVPFSSEYSILIKNLNSVRVVAHINIDGEDVVPGGLVIDGNREVDLERWIKNGNMKEGNRFKFIERTGAIEDHRGIKLEDGIIRIEYQFEKPYVQTWRTDPWYRTDAIGGWNGWNDRQYTKGIMRGVSSNALGSTQCNAVFTSSASLSADTPVGSATSTYNDAGITVPGSKSEQKFQTASWFPTETEKHAMVIKLLGETPDNKPVLQPVTVKTQPKCTSCGRKNKATAKFCSGCGTALEIFA